MAKKTYSKKYLVNGEKVPGVTTIIKGNLGWGTQALIGWAVKVTKEGKDHRNMMEDAADAGVLAHTMVEQYVRKELKLSVEDPATITEGYTSEQIVAASHALEAFHLWLKGSKYTIVGSEIEVVHDALRYGGTIDLLLQDDAGRVHVADVKTTNYLLPDHLIQVAAYSYGYAEKHPGLIVGGGHLLRFSKGEATTFHHTHWSTEALRLGMEAFKHLLGLQSLKKNIDGAC